MLLPAARIAGGMDAACEWGPSEYESEGPHPDLIALGRRLPGFLALCGHPPSLEAATEIPVTRFSGGPGFPGVPGVSPRKDFRSGGE
jgi:hypothetical protein